MSILPFFVLKEYIVIDAVSFKKILIDENIKYKKSHLNWYGHIIILMNYRYLDSQGSLNGWA